MKKPDNNIRPYKILIVDDIFEIRVSLIAALEDAEYETVEAEDGVDALRKFVKECPDLAILDVKMPRLSGVEVCRNIRRHSDIPIIMFSAMESEMDKVDAIEAGANDYLVKGVGMDELIARVRSQLTWAQMRREDEIPPVSTSGVLPDYPLRREEKINDAIPAISDR